MKYADPQEDRKNAHTYGVTKLRELFGMRSLESKKRLCMRCEQPFRSEGNHHRMCNICNDQASRGTTAFDRMP